jgi:hypothetical protein
MHKDNHDGWDDVWRIYSAALAGRRAVVVGPAVTVLGTGAGASIESFDIVIRINHQWPVPVELWLDVGRRADVVYHCCNNDHPIQRLFPDDIRRPRFIWHDENAQSAALRALCAARGIPCAGYEGLRTALIAALDTHPSTGLTAICHALGTDLRELHVTGFSFHQSRYYPGYPGEGANPGYWGGDSPPVQILNQDFGKQRRYFKQLCARDPRITVDDALQAHMHNW